MCALSTMLTLIPYFSCLTFLPQATVDIGDPAHLLCLALRIFKSQYTTAHISHSYVVPFDYVGSGALPIPQQGLEDKDVMG